MKKLEVQAEGSAINKNLQLYIVAQAACCSFKACNAVVETNCVRYQRLEIDPAGGDQVQCAVKDIRIVKQSTDPDFLVDRADDVEKILMDGKPSSRPRPRSDYALPAVSIGLYNGRFPLRATTVSPSC